MDRRRLIGGIALSILAAPAANAAQPLTKADALYPFLKMYLQTPPEQRNRFLLAYYVMRDRKPAPDVKAFLVGPGGRRPIAIAGDARILTLPSLADLNAGVQVEIDAAPGDKIAGGPEVLATMPMAARLDTHQLALAMEQANAAIAAHAGILSFAAPKLTCAYLFGAHSGQAVAANGHGVELPVRNGPFFPSTPYFDSAAMPDARTVVLDKPPSRIVLGGKPRN
ncbi:MAG TPA: hypothetical protein VHZ26_13930 [Caulobacteraceae bacterium]|nr:hypothetical protein [Caulobacteraceae bacterium]